MEGSFDPNLGRPLVEIVTVRHRCSSTPNEFSEGFGRSADEAYVCGGGGGGGVYDGV